jgi:3-dehydro-4-phosphotetronate decarboxylase
MNLAERTLSLDDAAAAICRVGLSLHSRGYVHATAGNISMQLPDGSHLITPTDAQLGRLNPATLAHVDAQGKQRRGDRASKTLALHRSIYASAGPHARCIIHTHSTHLVALTLIGVWHHEDIVPPVTPYYVMKVGHTPLIDYRRPGDPEAAAQVAQRIEASVARGKPLRAVMLDRLGPVVWGPSADEACATLEELEETAKIWLLSGRSAQPLRDADIEQLKTAFGAVW